MLTLDTMYSRVPSCRASDGVPCAPDLVRGAGTSRGPPAARISRGRGSGLSLKVTRSMEGAAHGETDSGGIGSDGLRLQGSGVSRPADPPSQVVVDQSVMLSGFPRPRRQSRRPDPARDPLDFHTWHHLGRTRAAQFMNGFCARKTNGSMKAGENVERQVPPGEDGVTPSVPPPRVWASSSDAVALRGPRPLPSDWG